MLEQLFHNVIQAREAHVENRRGTGNRERAPIGFATRLLRVACHETHAVGVLAMGERYPGIGRTADRRGDSRHHGETDSCPCERLEFFPASAKDEGVAAL